MIHIEAGATDTTNPMVLTESVLALGALTASTEAEGFEGANAVAENTFDGWQPTELPATLSVALGSPYVADCLGIAAHDLGSTGATIFVEYLDGTWIEAASFAPSDDSAILILFPEASSDEWRVRVTGSTVPTIKYMSLGSRTVFQTGIVGDYTPTNWGAEVEIYGGQTNAGQFLGQRVRRRGAQTTVSLGRVTRASFALGGEAFAEHYNMGRPFFFAGWPAGLPNDVALCWRAESAKEIRPSITQGDWVPMSFKVRCHVAA